MKIWYLLIGFMICAAGTGAIQPSVGFLGAEDASSALTPFLVFGHVWYEDGSPCNNPNISITNPATGAARYADAVSGCNFYQAFLTLADVNVSDPIEWTVTDGAVVNTTNRTVGQGDLRSGGIFGFNLTLESQPRAPFVICGWVNYTNGAPCDAPGINITNPNTGASWQAETLAGYSYYELILNSTDVISGVTLIFNATDGAGFNITSHTVSQSDLDHGGVFGVNLTLTNHTVSQNDLERGCVFEVNLTLTSAPIITGYAPNPSVHDIENATRRFNITIDQTVNVTWLINDSEVQTNESITNASYTNTSAVVGVWNVSVIVENVNGTDTKEWIWHVITLPSPILIYGKVYENNTDVDAPCVVITNLNTSRKFVADNRTGSNFYQIITDASEMRENNTLLINASKDGTPIGNGSVQHTVTQPESRRGAIRVDINKGWADLQVAGIFPPPYMFDNETSTITARVANNGTASAGGFNASLAVGGSMVNRTYIGSLGAGETVDVTFNWTPAKTGYYTLNVTADSDGEIDESNEANNNASMVVFVGVPDFTVLDVVPDSDYCVIRDNVGITATVANLGVKNDTAVVVFYDNGTLNITRRGVAEWQELGQPNLMNDTITIPDALAIRVHFSSIGSTIYIYDKNGSEIGVISSVTDYWTGWVSGDTIRIEGFSPSFTINKYQALIIATDNVTLTAGEHKPVTASYRNATQGLHDLSVAIDPHNIIPEYNEANNSHVAPIYVDGFDLEVDVDDTILATLYVDDTVNITAIITNHGVVDASNFTLIFEDDISGDKAVFNEILVPSLCANSSINFTVPWNLTGANTSIFHNLTVGIPFEKSLTLTSRHWPKDDNDMTNNVLPLSIPIESKWDFSVENVTVTPSEIMEGETIDITATIGNLGHVAGNVSVGFYIDMWDNILGVSGDLDAFKYHDCFGAARGWSRDDVSNATGRYIRIGTGDVWVDANTTNTTSIRWDADTAAENHTIMVVVDHEERLDEWNCNISIHAETNIKEEVFGNNNGTCSLNITPPDLSITSIDLSEYADVGDMVDITAVVRNNEDTQAKSTLWWVVERDEPIRADFAYPQQTTWGPWSATYPGGIMMRAHFKHLELGHTCAYCGCGSSSVHVQVDDSIVYSRSSGVTKDNFWTPWGLGSTLKVNAGASGSIGHTASANFTIDKYQVVIDGRLITLDANESGSYNTIWDATVLAGRYTVWADVVDQNKSSTIIVNETDLAVTELSVPDEVMDGDLVEINLTIANLGRMDAGNFTVVIDDLWKDCGSYDEQVTTRDFSGLTAGDSIRISVPWTASLKNGSRISHNHNISVTVTPDDKLPEINRDNDENETEVHISKSRDFSVADLTFTVDNITRTPDPTTGRVCFMLGENVIMNASLDVINHANCRGSVVVGFYLDTTNNLIGTETITFDTGREYAEYEWTIDAAGNRSIIVVVDPSNETYELDESNNKLDPRYIYVQSPDFVVEEITFNPEIPEVGDLVNITATVGNFGDKGESNITVAYTLSREDEHIESPHEYPNDWNYTCTIHAPGAHKMRIHFGNINIRRRYLSGVGYLHDHVYVYDMNGSKIHDYEKCYGCERTTDWIDGDSVTVKLVSFSGSEDYSQHVSRGTNWGFLIDRIDMRLEDKTSLDLGENKTVSAIWNASRAGSYLVNVTIDPENEIPEHNEENNTRIEGIEVQGADLTVSNLSLTVNGSTVDQIIEHGDPVNITATIANIGVRDAHNINVSVSIGVTEIDRTNINLSRGESINISTIWDTTPREYIGDRTVKIFADCDYTISETNESNNTLTEDVYVCTPELSGSISWDPENPLDEDLVTINATITNSGCIPAENFTVLMFYDNPGEGVYSKTYRDSCSALNASRRYDSAEWVYVRITGTTSINQGDLMVYDGNNTEIARPDGPCWIAVPGDTARVKGIGDYKGKRVTIRFYAVYPGNLLEFERLDVGSTTNITLVQKVTSFDHTITVHIDPEDDIPENDETDNTVSEVMYVTPTRDFTVTNVTAAETNLSDTNTTEITAEVANIGFRNGTTNVSFVDYERENRRHSYWFDKSIAGETQRGYRPPYAPVSPPVFVTARPDDTSVRSTIIHRPGMDAIELDLTYSLPCGTDHHWISVHDESGSTVGEKIINYIEYCDNPMTGSETIYVDGDTITIWASEGASYTLHGYTTIHEFNRTEVVLNATEDWNEPRTLAAIWTASTGDHTITVATDTDDEIGEIDESNNNKSILIHVDPSRDPAIINLTNSPLHPVDGDDVVITAEVRNNGTDTANFTIDFWEDTQKKFTASSSDITVPGASWVGVHFKSIDAYTDKYVLAPQNDVWAGYIGDTPARTVDHGPMDPRQWRVGMIDAYYDDWYTKVDKIRYKKLINRTHVTLLANETRNVTAVWEKMSIAGTPRYHAIVIVDPEDEIDEIDESNNEMSREIVMNYPDLAVGRFDPPTADRDARVKIENTGIGSAAKVNVTFEYSRREDCKRSGYGRRYTIPEDCPECRGKRPDDGPEAFHTRVHFDYISVRGGDMRIAKSKRNLYRGIIEKIYNEDVDDVWSPWVEGDDLVILSKPPGMSFYADLYEWGDVEEETIDHLDARGGGHDYERLEMKMEEWEWEYTEPLNLTVRVDPEDSIPEFDEGNNERTVLMYADLVPETIVFFEPQENKLCLDIEEFTVDVTIRNKETLGRRDGIAFPVVSDFNFTFGFSYPNGTSIFNVTEHVDETLYAGDPVSRRFTFDVSRFNGSYGNLTAWVKADSSDVICESNDLYPDGELNNYYEREVEVHEFSGYTGGGELINVAQGEVNGRVVYTVGDSHYTGLMNPGVGATFGYTDVIPDDLNPNNIEFARLFVYWFTWYSEGGTYVPVPAGVDVTFNGHSLGKKAGNYSDNPGAATYDCGYGVYSYDVRDHVINGENEVSVRNNADVIIMGVHAIGLLVVYEDCDEPLTKYWINEGADIQLAKNGNPTRNTGLEYDKCIAHAHFKDVESDDLDRVDARLMTILGMMGTNSLHSDAGGEGDRLWFNDYKIGTSIAGTNQRHYWKHLDSSRVAVTHDQWDDVTDYLKKGGNEATMGSRGNFIMPNNAFLRLIFPPDLNVIDLTVPAYTVVGAHHTINVTIRNDGRSDAHDFNVTFYIDGKQMVRRSGYDLPAGENMTIHLDDWTPMLLMHVYNLTAAADVLSGEDWTEVETDNNALTKYVNIEEGGFGNQTGPRGIGGGGNPTGGEYTETITGRIMQGAKFLTFGGGGGAGMFSALEWIMKGAVWFVLVLFVYAGYRAEQRSYGRVRVGLRQPY